MSVAKNPEQTRLNDVRTGKTAWVRWGPYLSERQWGTVREDYSADGDAWNALTHDMARSKAYRWGEDGIGGLSDIQQRLCLAVALWNGRDPILKERLFGLTNLQGNHGEDVKELYYFLDATPTHTFLRMLYKYPQDAFPYEQLIEENGRRGLDQPEFELADTGVFDDDRYFDVEIAYAKADTDDILMKVTVTNRAAAAATVHVLPHVWFRDTWSWDKGAIKPALTAIGADRIGVADPVLGRFAVYCEGPDELLFCDNETNVHRLYGIAADGHFKDAFHDAIVDGDRSGLNRVRTGTKACAVYRCPLAAGASRTIRLRLRPDGRSIDAFGDFDKTFATRLAEADAFYAGLQTHLPYAEERRVHRQALAGMIWSKQFYCYDVSRWLDGDPTEPPPPPERVAGRNSDWRHVNAEDVISMPDTWEYPWFAAWDTAFHAVAMAGLDAEFAKRQMILLEHEWYMHPNGQIPAYEWNFSDVNPPVRAWAAWQIYQIDRHHNGGNGDLVFLERVFHKFLINFTWWVNRKDHGGRNIFQGGFLGLDNIGCFDRSAPLPTGGTIKQSDGTAWMAMFALNLMRIALELARHNHVYEDLATKFFEHFLAIAAAMKDIAGRGIGLWDDEDKFYYDVLDLPGEGSLPLKVRSMVGLIPLCAVEILDAPHLASTPDFARRLTWYLHHRPDLARLVSRWDDPGHEDRRLLSLMRADRMKSTLARMLDPEEFLSPFGIRSVSRAHLEHPYVFENGGRRYDVHYVPGESDSRLFGGNSNWRGPIWIPVNYLIIQSLRRFHSYYGDGFKVECPTGSGQMMSLARVADELSRRVVRIFLPDQNGRRPVWGDAEKLQTDPHFRDNLLFFEYFHGDSGRGCGASHQTGWTGLIAKMITDLHDPVDP
ncbi:MAG: glucosidase [Rhodospirillales bacterium]